VDEYSKVASEGCNNKNPREVKSRVPSTRHCERHQKKFSLNMERNPALKRGGGTSMPARWAGEGWCAESPQGLGECAKQREKGSLACEKRRR